MLHDQWKSKERYYAFSYFLKEKFPYKVYKIPIHAGFTCPNMDGKVAKGGCVYCANESFSPNVKDNFLSIGEQVTNGKKFLRKRYGAEKFIVYFQSYSNTYADVKILREKYDQALDNEDIVGLSIGTRPDCVSEEIIELIRSYTNDYHVWVEYGLQSSHDRTLEKINRGHLYDSCVEAVNLTKDLGIYICLHVILGLQDENRDDMMETAKKVTLLGVDGLKIHHLYVSKNTAMAYEYLKGNVKTLSLEKYVTIAADFLEYISPEITIQRLMGDIRGEYLISPIWSVSKSKIIDSISAELERRGSCQGSKVSCEVNDKINLQPI